MLAARQPQEADSNQGAVIGVTAEEHLCLAQEATK